VPDCLSLSFSGRHGDVSVVPFRILGSVKTAKPPFAGPVIRQISRRCWSPLRLPDSRIMFERERGRVNPSLSRSLCTVLSRPRQGAAPSAPASGAVSMPAVRCTLHSFSHERQLWGRCSDTVPAVRSAESALLSPGSGINAMIYLRRCVPCRSRCTAMAIACYWVRSRDGIPEQGCAVRSAVG
jgi:hypothetical protein